MDSKAGKIASQLSEAAIQQVLFFLTTEHSTLQGARGNTISETNGRMTLFLGTVSSGLIALGFIGTEAGDTFFVFGLILFPLLFSVGLLTFERVLQSSIEDIFYARGINRIRHFYTELVPEMAPYFVLSTHDDVAGAFKNMGTKPTYAQLLFSGAGIVSVINSILFAVFVCFALRYGLGSSAVTLLGVGLASFGASFFLHQQFQISARRKAAQRLEPMFPSTPTKEML
jgi:hypothetical protein